MQPIAIESRTENHQQIKKSPRDDPTSLTRTIAAAITAHLSSKSLELYRKELSWVLYSVTKIRNRGWKPRLRNRVLCAQTEHILLLSRQLFRRNKPEEPEQSSRVGDREERMCGDDCRPLAFLLGLPFALLSLLVSIVGIIIWILGLLLTLICPCFLCVTLIVEFALELIKAPLHVMEWFTSQIPC